ncbi:MAG: IS91 family transposase [Gammaproteobacteria bacterium]|nr:IS91 family transposase [Gammaproteobacteria bacterium]
MSRPPLEVADIFRAQGLPYRTAHRGRLSLGQLKVMSAIERCRTAELGGHKLHCDTCNTDALAYNSCRNRHCPKCQASAAQRWLEARQADVLPVPYFHVVFTLPEALRAIAWQNKAVIYGLLFNIAAETLLNIAADKKHLGAHIGITAVLHTWGSSLIHHPHLHCIVTGGGLSDDHQHWVASRPNFLVPVKVLSRLFKRRFLEALLKAHDKGQLSFFADLEHLRDPAAFAEHLRPLQTIDWVVYAKRPLAGPDAVLTYLSRYTHRIAISNRRLLSFDERGVTFRYKDYRNGNANPWTSMTLTTDEFMRRFLLHVLPSGFHRIRHYGLFANASRKHNLKIARALLKCQPRAEIERTDPTDENPQDNAPTFTCRHCGEPMIVVELLIPQHAARAPPQRQAA